jgi:hypothetical protein
MSTRAVLRHLVILLFLLLAAGGCGDAHQYQTVPVSGVITCKGVPVANAMVNFTPLEQEDRAQGQPGRVALGMTDKDGRFTLTTYENNDGAIVGRHTVTVGFNSDAETGRDPNRTFPCRDSSKEVTVEPGMGEIKIEL